MFIKLTVEFRHRLLFASISTANKQSQMPVFSSK